MKQNLEGLTVVLTGAGGGIGRATAVALAKRRMNVILFGGNKVEKLKETCRQVGEFSACCAIPGNLTDLDKMDAMVAEASNAFGKIDVLINNAGVAQSTAFEDISVEEYDAIMNINLRAPFFLTQKILPYLKQSNSASIINICSVVSHAGYPLQSAYTASKHAMLGFTKSLAAEYFSQGIRVHAIAPGGVYTDMVKISRPDLKPEGMIMPEDIADIVLFFLENRGNAVVDEIKVHRMNKQPFLV